MRLKGKVAVITGAGRGLGRASAIEMATEGASLVLLSRTFSELEGTARTIKNAGGNVVYLKADAAKSSDVNEVIDKAIFSYGKIDILLNNAAIAGPVKPIFKVDEGEWESVLNINLKGVFLFSKAVIPHMMKQGGGKIVNVTSGLGEMVLSPLGAYSITKAGVTHFTRILAAELAEYNIQVNGLDPGVMNTPMQNHVRELGPEVLGEGTYQKFALLKERGLLKRPEHVALLAIFLASEASDSITGEIGTESYYGKFGYRGKELRGSKGVKSAFDFC